MQAQKEHKPYIGSEAFERVKLLKGEWVGTMDMGQGPEKITASYKLTAAGSAIVETVFEGAPHEMVSVYHDNKDRILTMTHYCAEHNQPRFVLKNMGTNMLTLDLSGSSDIDVAHEKHIHAVSIQFDGHDKMTHQWVSFEGGEKKQVVAIDYKRVR